MRASLLNSLRPSLLLLLPARYHRRPRLLVTRATPEGRALLEKELSGTVTHERSGCVTVGGPEEEDLLGLVAVTFAAGLGDAGINAVGFIVFLFGVTFLFGGTFPVAARLYARDLRILDPACGSGNFLVIA